MAAHKEVAIRSRKMTLDYFWNLVQAVHHDSDGDMDLKCKLLDERLRKLTCDEVRAFGEHFGKLVYRAYSWELWAAAFIIGHGCSDDSFMDFRSALISMGRDVFENALVDPESLADINYSAEQAFYEGYQYIVGKVYRHMGGQRVPRSRTRPAEPSGRKWEETKVAELYPKLARHYNFP
jgi:hypothetical protein